MILRSLALVVGLGCGMFSSQLPEFSQQYVQRLGGAVDALDQVVADFDRSAAAEGLSRDAALAQMHGTAFVERRRDDMQRTFTRHQTLTADLKRLQTIGPFRRTYHATQMDTDIARATLRTFKPALPLTFAGLVFTAVGFVTGWLAALALFTMLRTASRGSSKHA